jgi:hypothetical protein
MPRTWTLIVLLGLWAGALAGCYVVSPYAYPAYGPPYPPPGYRPPPAAGPPPLPPAGPRTTAPPTGAPPGGATGRSDAPEGPGRSCESVTVEGHWETQVRPDGRRESVWVPTRDAQVCR